MITLDHYKELILEDYEILSTGEKEWVLFDLSDGKEVFLRNPKQVNKIEVLEDIVDIGTSHVNKEKLIHLLSALDDSLFWTVRKILFIKDEEDYENLMQQFDNVDMIDFEEELGKYLYFEDWVIINLSSITNTAKEMSFFEEELKREINIGIWTTLIHELRHSYQSNPLYPLLEKVNENIEEDAEKYAIQEFETKIINQDYHILL